MRKHYPNLRTLIGEVVTASGFVPTVSLEAGAEVELIVRRRGKALLLNLLNRGAEETLGPNRVMIETLPTAHDITVRISMDAWPKRVTMQSNGTAVPFTYRDGVEIAVPDVAIYEILEVE